MRKLLVALPLVVAVALAALFYVGLERENPQELRSALLGKPAPAFDLPGLGADAPRFTQADLATGKPVLVNVFASWCAPCRIEHPFLTALVKEHGVTLYGIAYKDDPAATQRFLDQLGNPFARIGLDRSGRTGIEWGIAGVPETFVVDGEGKVVFRQWGPVTTPDQQQRLLRILKDAERGGA